MKNHYFLVDLVDDFEGHYFIMEALYRIDGASLIDTREKKLPLRKHPVRGYIERWRMYRRVFKQISREQSGPSVAHFLTADKFYPLPLLCSPEKKDLKVLATVHHFPNDKFRQRLLKNFGKRITSYIVMSDHTANRFRAIGIDNVTVIPFPAFYRHAEFMPKEYLREKFGIGMDKIVISALGGTRKEKGLDILLESFKYLPAETKKKLLVNIAGQEMTVNRPMIEKLARENGIDIRLDLRILEEDEFCQNVAITDIMAIPYRRSFVSAASGPMCEAVNLGIPCVVCNHGSFGDYTAEHKIGLPFESEDPKSLAEALQKMVDKQYELDPSLIGTLSLEEFIRKHNELYNSVLSAAQ